VKAAQDAIIAGAEGDRNKILKVVEEVNKAVDCLVQKNIDDDLTFFGTKVRDTRERIFAQEDFDLALNGTFWGSSGENPCQ
jgi:hypothetical protein